MIKPVNGHLLIEPLKHETFMATQKETFEEVGIVVALPRQTVSSRNETVDLGIPSELSATRPLLTVGDKVFFDSWLAAKYPNGDKDFYWLVKWSDVRAIEQI